ncbi:thiol:disulfide interchange protein DsbA/DsbL [Kitasatospora sp. LaBMicrA B282]|uniref:thiol:disulfide interchange protein DsbA/DsbL n=1 Tax=Kitasatospora sp. LaBMicrA B282 TaxID=3420949 RepID=UPI003D0A2747
MKSVTRAVVLLLSAACTFTAAAPSATATAADDPSYVKLQHPQALHDPATGKVEVVEVFWYGCQHSQLLEQPLEDWAAKHAQDVVLRRLPAVWPGESDQTVERAHARLFFTLDRLGQVPRLQRAVFHAVRDEGRDLTTESAAADWAATQGVDRQGFTAAYESDQVKQEVAAAPDDFKRYEITELPSAVVQGRFLTYPTRTNGVQGMPQVMDRLVDQARSGARS